MAVPSKLKANHIHDDALKLGSSHHHQGLGELDHGVLPPRPLEHGPQPKWSDHPSQKAQAGFRQHGGGHHQCHLLTNTGPVALMSMCLKSDPGAWRVPDCRPQYTAFPGSSWCCSSLHGPAAARRIYLNDRHVGNGGSHYRTIIIISGGMGSVIMSMSITSRSQPVL